MIYAYIYIYIYIYCGAKESDNPDPLCIGPKARAEEGEIAEDGQRKPKWPRNVVEDDPALSILEIGRAHV